MILPKGTWGVNDRLHEPPRTKRYDDSSDILTPFHTGHESASKGGEEDAAAHKEHDYLTRNDKTK